MKEVQLFKRGQVWYIDDNSKQVGSIQGKSRPYLVVSNDKCNANSPVIHMAPLTTKDKVSLPTHVSIHDPYRNIDQLILLEQIMPKSVPDINPLSTYRYSLTDEKMMEVDKAIAAQFGLPYLGISTDDFEALLDEIKNKKLTQLREEAHNLINDRAESYASKITEAVESVAIPAPNTDKIESSDPGKFSNPSAVERFNRRFQKTQEIQGKSNNSQKNRTKWTDDLKREFLADVDKLPAQEVLNKYNITMNTYKYNICVFRKDLGIPAPHASKGGRPKKITYNENNPTNNEDNSDAEQFLKDYDSKPISDVMRLYNLPDKKSVVNLAASYRMKLGR